MTPGKACSQAGHAYLMAYEAASVERKQRYHSDGLGTKICLRAPSLESLLEIEQWAKTNSLPHHLITDTGANTSFLGVDTVSCLGVGPLSPAESKRLKHLKLLP